MFKIRRRLIKNNLLSNGYIRPLSYASSKLCKTQKTIMGKFQSSYKTFLTLSDSYYKILSHTFCLSSYQTILKHSDSYYQTRHTFCQSQYKTVLIFLESCYQKHYTHFLESISNNIETFRVTTKQYYKYFPKSFYQRFYIYI